MEDYFKEEIAIQDYISDLYEKKRYAKPYSLAYHDRWAKKMLSSLNLRNPILDNGCGIGFMTQYLKGHEVVGLDMSSGMIKLAKKRYSKIVQGDSQNLPFKDFSFQTVINRGILHHLENPQKAVDEVNRILIKGGEAVFSEPLFNIFAALPRKLIRGTKHFSHLHKCFKDREFKKMIGSHFEIKKVYYWGFLSHILLGFPDFFDIYRFFPLKKVVTPFLLGVDELISRIPFLNKYLCWHIIIIAKKV